MHAEVRERALAARAADTHGNVACFSRSTEELWMRHVRSLVAQGPTAGDINGDGEIEVGAMARCARCYLLSCMTMNPMHCGTWESLIPVHMPRMHALGGWLAGWLAGR